MSERRMVLALAFTLVALPAFADHGKHGGGGSSSSVHSTSSSGSHASGSHASHVSDGRGGAPLTDAERRHPRPGTGTGRFYGGGYYRPYSYYGFYGYPYYGSWGYPYFDYGIGSYGGGYYPAYGYGAYRHYRDSDSAALRILVDPDDARVLVDGHYAGVVDDFDGIFQRLYVSPGRHEITLKKDGYRTHRMKIYVGPDQTLKIKYKLVRGEGEDPVEDLAGDAPAEPPYVYDRDRRDRDDRSGDRDERGDGRVRDDDRAGSGMLRLSVRPSDASVYVDGEFRGANPGSLELPPGVHRVEVVRPGYKTFDREVDIRPGRTETVTVELERR